MRIKGSKSNEHISTARTLLKPNAPTLGDLYGQALSNPESARFRGKTPGSDEFPEISAERSQICRFSPLGANVQTMEGPKLPLSGMQLHAIKKHNKPKNSAFNVYRPQHEHSEDNNSLTGIRSKSQEKNFFSSEEHKYENNHHNILNN